MHVISMDGTIDEEQRGIWMLTTRCLMGTLDAECINDTNRPSSEATHFTRSTGGLGERCRFLGADQDGVDGFPPSSPSLSSTPPIEEKPREERLMGSARTGRLSVMLQE
ncbi:hypothetical protein PRIPAC_81070 [Pristionchus pacificus]|uniref:Uncharacterized protein n=1 Tax=Pristionchus pacificus TaxID=54126 RepID=A0A2A6BXX1_PRIPA|nr:hypothetical protein PRIPAC_81070 [Pristionchus pacificus]|eukprot:PDM70852.1 hypothetical protein PRIPAC_45056 [Pristionchus pacificus]